MMIVAWKYRTSFENAYDSFEKISKFQKSVFFQYQKLSQK